MDSDPLTTTAAIDLLREACDSCFYYYYYYYSYFQSRRPYGNIAGLITYPSYAQTLRSTIDADNNRATAGWLVALDTEQGKKSVDTRMAECSEPMEVL